MVVALIGRSLETKHLKTKFSGTTKTARSVNTTTEELSCGGTRDSRDRYQRFEGGVIYWRAAADTAIAYTKGASGEDHQEFPCR